MTVIAMTREMGSRGKDVALGLASRFGLEIIHHELIEHRSRGTIKLARELGASFFRR